MGKSNLKMSHNILPDLQGGTDDEYYHLTSAEHISFGSLIDNSIVNTLHRHSELVNPAGSIDPALSIDADGKVTLHGSNNAYILNDTAVDNFSWFYMKGAATGSSMLISLGTGATSVGGIAAVYGGAWGSNNIQIYHDGSNGYLSTGAGDLVLSPNGNIILVNQKILYTENIRAKDSDGLYIADDGGNLGIHIADGGNVKVQNTEIVSAYVKINKNGSGNRYAYIDLIGDGTYTGFGLRLSRTNTGPNTISRLEHRGTGSLEIRAHEAAPIIFKTTDITRLTLAADGTINITGSLLFTGAGKGLAFAEIWAFDVNNTLTITGTGIVNKVQVTSFAVNGLSNNATPDHTNDHITITKAGLYKVNISASIESVGGVAYKIAVGVFKNNGAYHFQNLHVSRNLAGGCPISMTGIIDLAVNDTIEVWTWNETDTNNIVVDDITMNLLQIAGT